MVDLSHVVDKATLKNVFKGKLLVTPDVHAAILRDLEERVKNRNHIEPYLRSCLRKLGHLALLTGTRKAHGLGIVFFAHLGLHGTSVTMELHRWPDRALLMLGANQEKGGHVPKF